MVNGISVRFDTRVYDGSEVILLYYRVNGVLGCRFFTETYNPRTNEVCSAVSNMVRFVYCLMGRGVEYSERCCCKH